jgi:hypothetical protein
MQSADHAEQKTWLEVQREETWTALRFVLALGPIATLLWYGVGSGGVVRLIAGILFLGALCGVVKLAYHGTALWLSRLEPATQGRVQCLLGIIAAALPLLYFAPRTKPLAELVRAIDPGWATAAMALFIGWLGHAIGGTLKLRVPVHAYFSAVIGFAVLSFMTAAGMHYESDGEEGSWFIYPDDGLVSHRDRALFNYLIYIAASFVGITLGLMKNGVRFWRPETWAINSR